MPSLLSSPKARIGQTATNGRCNALIVVLGDLGRSPRMLNHARALRARGWAVTLAGSVENALPPDLEDDPAVQVTELGCPRGNFGSSLRRLASEVRRQAWTAILIQNPPGFPALVIAALARRPRSRLVLDWHNLGGSLLALRPSSRRHLAGLYSWCERQAARLADDHWTVSQAMAGKLSRPATIVVYDRPSKVFNRAALGPIVAAAEEKAIWWRRVLPDLLPPPPEACWIAAPSSWGPDEDPGAMLRAAHYWQENAAKWGSSPRVVVIATGKGPEQAAFTHAAQAFRDGPIALKTAWVPAEEYPAFLAHCDAALCLHRSSSGLDLPMKLADFRGAGRKALVLDYGAVLREMFRPEADGWTFRDSLELATKLRTIALAAPADRIAIPVAGDTWEDEWNRQLGGWAAAQESAGSQR